MRDCLRSFSPALMVRVRADASDRRSQVRCLLSNLIQNLGFEDYLKQIHAYDSRNLMIAGQKGGLMEDHASLHS